MAVNISIKDYPKTDPIVFEDDDPIYWFLYPYFEETAREVGQMVDLYGDAEFYAEVLLAFFLILEKAEKDTRLRSQAWMVTIGYEGEHPIRKIVRKTDVLESIQTLKQLLNDAYNMNREVVCSGD